MSSQTMGETDLEAMRKLKSAFDNIKQQLSRVIVGQDQVIEELLIALFSRGHCMLEGVPGLAKTLMISTLSQCLSLDFSRIQFTPDLMPSDITGTDVIEENPATGTFELQVPARARCSPTSSSPTKSTARRRRRRPPCSKPCRSGRSPSAASGTSSPNPFFVLATQNPIEQEGTYPLPEAQQDRFMFKVFVKYPSFKEEFEIARRTTGVQQRRDHAGADRRADPRDCRRWSARCR